MIEIFVLILQFPFIWKNVDSAAISLFFILLPAFLENNGEQQSNQIIAMATFIIVGNADSLSSLSLCVYYVILE